MFKLRAIAFSIQTLKRAGLICIGFGIASACSKSYDLGNKSGLSLEVNEVGPTWENGIGSIAAQKCANCHTDRPNKFVPANVTNVGNLDVETKFNSLVCAGTIKELVLNHDGGTIMPPKFSTQLTISELRALSLYVEKSKETFCKKAVPLAPTAQPGTVGTVVPNPTAPPAVRLAYSDVKDIIDKRCVRCHQSGRKDLQTLESIKKLNLKSADGMHVLSRVEDGTMPPESSPPFKDSDSGKKLMEWLKNGVDLR